jgi:hypothetical protein
MEWLIVIAVAFGIWFWLRSKTRTTRRAASDIKVPELKITINTSAEGAVSGLRETRNPDTGELVAVASDAWVLNPKSPLPMTIYNADRELALTIKLIIGKARYWTQKIPEIALLIAQHNLRFKEVDAFVAHYKPKYEAELARLIASSREWEEASDKDREDLRAEFEESALKSLGVSVGQADLSCILKGEPTDFREDDDLVRRFRGNSNLYSFYLSLLGNSQVMVVKADDYWRKSWEELVENGFARRGKDIPTHLVLDSLRLKDLNELLAGAVEKPLGRKAKAIEVALSLPDLSSRMSSYISYREMFQAVPPTGIDITALINSFTYATALASVAQQTYYTGIKTLEAIEESKRSPGIYDAWEVTNWEDPTPPCAVTVCRKYNRLPSKLPPFHIGCACQLECAFQE